ncbi:LEAF RUST 10 DISEASE-RESISTANCE LOCUS RECEPTOR-LIKE PROTEIN KINASE-like 2.1 [Ziziphus jujuba]|uniref:non-specific serine/threonine protein kinase n=1 Tax=Ziziphus jujuba TaxID=326968 RepID=A0ABM3IFC0_ZIZJJ|nr:LEAF RUST 10 DISEASE-RESISTANCE LOCUS RECEPTOR-LIKE PROTEIN KINASE-like 2.1 [Ziziphus jujuba]
MTFQLDKSVCNAMGFTFERIFFWPHKMHPNPSKNISLLILIHLVILLIHGPSSSFADNYADCGKPFNCGSNIQNISYPFWGSDRPEQCGHPKFELSCVDGVTEISINTEAYRVLEMNQDTRTLLAVRADYFGDVCKTELRNATLLDTTVFNYTADTQPLTLFYTCDSPNGTSILPHFNCSESGGSNTVNFYSVENLSGTPGNIPSELGRCEGSVVLNVSQTQATTLRNLATASNETLIKAVVDAGFSLVWNANDSLCDGCVSNGSRCGYNRGSEEFVCYQNQNSTGTYACNF